MKYGNVEIQQYRKTEIQRYGDTYYLNGWDKDISIPVSEVGESNNQGLSLFGVGEWVGGVVVLVG